MSNVNRNVRGGKNYKKMKSGNARRKSKNPDMPVDTTTGVDHYGIVSKRLGDNRLLVKLDNGVDVQAVIPGRFKRRVWFNTGDYLQVERTGDDYYDVIQKIVNESELAKAQTAVGKKENTAADVFIPDIEEEDEEDSEPDSEDEFDAFGNKIEKNDELSGEKKDDIKLNKTTLNVDKFKRKQKEKERDVSRRNNTRDYDVKPDSIIGGSESESESGSD